MASFSPATPLPSAHTRSLVGPIYQVHVVVHGSESEGRTALIVEIGGERRIYCVAIYCTAAQAERLGHDIYWLLREAQIAPQSLHVALRVWWQKDRCHLVNHGVPVAALTAELA